MGEHQIQQFCVAGDGPDYVRVSGYITHNVSEILSHAEWVDFRMPRERWEKASGTPVECPLCGEMLKA